MNNNDISGNNPSKQSENIMPDTFTRGTYSNVPFDTQMPASLSETVSNSMFGERGASDLNFLYQLYQNLSLQAENSNLKDVLAKERQIFWLAMQQNSILQAENESSKTIIKQLEKDKNEKHILFKMTTALNSCLNTENKKLKTKSEKDKDLLKKALKICRQEAREISKKYKEQKKTIEDLERKLNVQSKKSEISTQNKKSSNIFSVDRNNGFSLLGNTKLFEDNLKQCKTEECIYKGNDKNQQK